MKNVILMQKPWKEQKTWKKVLITIGTAVAMAFSIFSNRKEDGRQDLLDGYYELTRPEVPAAPAVAKNMAHKTPVASRVASH